MFVKRTAQLKLLEEQYASTGNNLVILYGRKGLGKTTLLSQFMADKPAYYYAALECEDILQLSLMADQWGINPEDAGKLSISELYLQLPLSSKKTVLVLDEFHYLLKNSTDFPDILRLFSEPDKPVMLILCSSSIRWVENEMIAALGNLAAYITSYIKLKEFSFVDFVSRFPKSTVESCIYINAILGGVPDYLNEWQEARSVK
jgi:AAA+ ATPase superfamily predicted ATPase